MPSRCLFAALATLLAVGCGGSSGTVPVQGVVLFEGRPLPKANVTFIAQSPDGRDARGTTDANGAFRLSTLEPDDGAVPGAYKVTVQLPIEVETSAVAATPDEAQQAMTDGRVRPKTPSIVLSPKYSQPDQAILVQEVPARGKIEIDLKKNP